MEGVLIVRKDGRVAAIAHNDLDKRNVVFYDVQNREMGLDEFKDLLTPSVVTEQ